jgi:hypothetical protein
MDMPRRSTLVPLNKVMVEMATKGHLALFDMRINYWRNEIKTEYLWISIHAGPHA